MRKLFKNKWFKRLAIFAGVLLVGMGCVLYSLSGYFHLFRRPKPRRVSRIHKPRRRTVKKSTTPRRAAHETLRKYYPMIESDQEVAVSIRPLFGVLEEKESLFDMDYENYHFVEKPSTKDKIEFVHALGNELTENQRQSLYYYLTNAPNDKDELYIKDEIMEKLEDQKIYPPEYIDALMALAADDDLDGDLRGYTVQHLRTAYATADEYDRKRIRVALKLAVQDRWTDVSGTAILAIANLSKEYKEDFNPVEINEMALDLASDAGVHLPSRITAVNVCGILKVHDSIETLRDIVGNSEDVTLNLAAIGAIGEIGTIDDLRIITDIGRKKFYKKATQLAMKKIIERDRAERFQ